MGGNYVIVHDPESAVNGNKYDVAVIIMDEPVLLKIDRKTDPYQLGIQSIKLNSDTNLPSSG